MAHLEADGQRLWNTLMASAEIGALPEGGLRRLALSDADREMRDLFASWAAQAGYQVSIDQLGTMIVRRQGSTEACRRWSSVATSIHNGQVVGSTVSWAYSRDLEVLRSLDDNGIETLRPIEVVNWTNEEGARFQPPMLCSSLSPVKRAWNGYTIARTVRAVVSVTNSSELAIAERASTTSIDSYFELHIEQGPKLEANGLKVGIVTGGYPSRGMRIIVRGENAHVGPTPMERRSNALVGAALVAAAVNDIGWQHASADGKTTAARLDLEPNLPGIISHFAQLYIDFRHPENGWSCRNGGRGSQGNRPTVPSGRAPALKLPKLGASVDWTSIRVSWHCSDRPPSGSVSRRWTSSHRQATMPTTLLR